MSSRTPKRAKQRAVILATAIAAAFAFPTGTGGATGDDPILHLWSRSWKGEICLVDGDGSDHRCLTHNRRFDYDAVWSPDRSRIAFVQQTNDPRNPDIYVMDADGTGKRRLTRSRRDDEEPQWSPDGTQLLWNRHRGDSPTGKIMVMKADGTGKHLLAGSERDDLSALWSPSGEQIVFSSRNPCYGQSCTIHQDDVHVIDADGSNERNLTQTDAEEHTPVWSPDGTRIAFVRVIEDDADIFLMNADGTGLTQLTDTPEWDFVPAWSPDGTRIAFTQVTDMGNFETRLALVDVRTREVSVLTTDEIGGIGPTWSPDGGHIAFTGHRSLRRTASYEIHAIRPDGSDLRRLTRTPGDESELDWGS